jgi:hypothetical protein
LVLSNYQGISQIASDSVTCIPNVQLRKAINLIETSKVYKKELDLSKDKIGLLEKRIVVKDSIIGKFESKEVLYAKLEADYKSEIRNWRDYANNTQKIYDRQKTLIFLGKFGKWVYLGVGVAAGIMISK